MNIFTFAIAWTLVSLAFASAEALSKDSEIISFNLEMPGPADDAVGYVIGNSAFGEEVKGFCAENSLATLSEITSIKVVVREYGTQPTWGLDVIIKPSLSLRLRSIGDDKYVVIFVDGVGRVRVRMKHFKDNVTRSVLLFVPLEGTNSTDAKLLAEKLKKALAAGKH